MSEDDHEAIGARVSGDAAREGARLRFRAFFEDAKQRFLERDDAFDQIALALLSKQHVLLTGPPGTAKSAISTAVLSNVVDRQSGEPSLFSRQFTESTVQTDLVGPLDFKTLMESGRSEHFTDEGMLGAVHAFLDEVLDGRDMLLRATLNVLHERELKQGTKTTKGRVECALMTTNRYLSEVLEQSRETLLAFIDRVAFVCFVPKGFGDASGLVRLLAQLTRGGPRRAAPLLTIQDVDLLQELVEQVEIPLHCNAALVEFLSRFEGELAAATRADPTFIPTRYISTRTVVRTAILLKAICVYDWVQSDGRRPLRVRYSDFERLRFTLLLSGPAREHVPLLLERETDPRERRQLSILQTERRIFDAALAELPPEPERDEAAERETVIALPSLAGLRERPFAEQLDVCRQLTEIVVKQGPGAREANVRLRDASSLIAQQALSRGLQAGLTEEAGQLAVDELMRLSVELDGAPALAGELAPWLRSRALSVLDAKLELVTGAGEVLRDVSASEWSLERAQDLAEAYLARLAHYAELREALLAGGATPGPRSHRAWLRAVERVEVGLAQIWERGLLACIASSREGRQRLGLDATLEALKLPLGLIDAHARTLSKFAASESRLTSRVLGTRLMPLLERAFIESAPEGRRAVAAAVEGLLGKLDDAGIHWAVSSEALIDWTTRALLQAERGETDSPRVSSHEGYRAFRAEQPKVSMCYALVEVCAHIAAYMPEQQQQPNLQIGAMRRLLATLSVTLRDQLIDADVRRMQSALSFFEAWWAELEAVQGEPPVRLQRVLTSRIHQLLEDEGVLLRFALEGQLLADLFPAAEQTAARLHDELLELSDRIGRGVTSLMQASSDAGWRELVSGDG